MLVGCLIGLPGGSCTSCRGGGAVNDRGFRLGVVREAGQWRGWAGSAV